MQSDTERVGGFCRLDAKDEESMCIFFVNEYYYRQCSVCDSKVHTSLQPVSSAEEDLSSSRSLSLCASSCVHSKY